MLLSFMLLIYITLIDLFLFIFTLTYQHDIVFNELTAEEHLRLFSILKNIDSKLINEEIVKKLKEVDLYNVRNKLVGSFSGGMKYF